MTRRPGVWFQYTETLNLSSDSTSRSSSAWPYWLAAAAVGICTAETAFRLTSGPERYEQFTVGSLTWRAASKHADYVLPIGLLAGFAGAWLLLLLTERRVERRLGSEGVTDLRSLVAYGALPLVIWASGLVLGISSTRDLVWLSAAGVCVAGVLMLIAASSPQGDSTGTTPGAAAGFVMLAVVFGTLSPLVAVLAANRLAIPATHAFVWTGRPSPLVLAVLGGLLGLVLGLWAWRGAAPRSNTRLKTLLVATQLLLPWGFLVVLPTPWAAGSFVRYGGPISAIPWIVFAMVGGAYLDLIRRLPVWNREAGGSQPVTLALSPLALAAALLFVKLAPISTRQLHPDDYHFGEYLLPWWSLTAHGAVPFWDYVPARGLINYLDAALASVTFGSSAAGIAASIGLASALVLIIGLVALAAWIGLLPAAAAFLMLPLDAQLTQVDALNTTALVLLLIALSRIPATPWLILWTIVGTLAFLMAPAQGSILVLATMPLGAWQSVRAFRAERHSLLRLGGGAALLAAVLLIATPLGRMIVGALRYAREHSAVSGPAHGFEWSLSAGSFSSLNPWLFEAVRASWMIVGMCAVALLLSAWIRKESERGRALLLVAVPIVIMAVFFVYRAAGRIDPGWVSRLGYVSIWMIALMLPLLLHAAWGARSWPAILTLTVAGSGLLTPQLGGILAPPAIGRRGLESEPPPTAVVRGFGQDLPNIGRVGLSKPDRLAGIQEALSVLLDSGETYLDLTNRNAQYFYLGREVPIESGAIYNLPNDRQQLRAIDRIRARRIPVVLALADSQIYDGAPPSYRVYTIYRYLVGRYAPVRIGDQVYLVTADRLRRLDSRRDLQAARDDPAGLLDSIFRLPDLQGLPASWGASWATLESSVSRIRDLGEPTALQGARALGAGSYASEVGGASLTWDLSATSLAGRDAGMLTFDFACQEPSADITLEVRWAGPAAMPDATTTVRFRSARRLAVPLDAAPRWLLAPAIGLLEIRVADSATCRQFSLGNVTLSQRRIAAAADAN
jgi:hypothetical protein